MEYYSSEDREFIGSAALMFDADIPVQGLRLQVGPQLNLAWLEAQQKTARILCSGQQLSL
jgi:hypothetical protein